MGALIFRILRMCKSVFHNNVSLTEDGLKHIGITPYGAKYIIVPYDEGDEVRTAFITSDVDRILRRGILWRQP